MSDAPPNRWVRHGAALCARTVLATLAGLLVWTVLPVLLGWQPAVVLSGSMEPAIRTGDVVVTREVPADQLSPGQVLLVDDPSGGGTRLLHRYDTLDDDGALVLRGDANEEADSAPVTADAVHGVGVLRVPWVGLPHVWLVQGRVAPVALTVLALGLCLLLARVRELPAHRQAPTRTFGWCGWGVAAATLLAVVVPATVTTDTTARFSSSLTYPVTFTTSAPGGP